MSIQLCSIKRLKVGVLAIIGSFIEHVHVTCRAAKELRSNCDSSWSNVEVEAVTVRNVDQVDDSLDALIVPGGETTVISRFIEANNFADRLKAWTKQQNKFVMGTCAGLIIFSNTIENAGRKPIVSIGGVDITCERNGFGRQRESHVVDVDVYDPRITNPYGNADGVSTRPFSGVFLRAPVIKSIDSDKVQVLCGRCGLADMRAVPNGSRSQPVGVMQDNIMAMTFHPELTDDVRWHAFFLRQALERKYGAV